MTRHETLCFWCDLYRTGIRVTCDGHQFVYHAVDWLRIHHTQRFGRFDIAPIAPPESIVTEVEARSNALLLLLTQPVPSELSAWWYHPLSLDYEARPLAAMAARFGTAVYLEPCRLGIWPVVLPDSTPEPSAFTLPALAPILRDAGYSYDQDAYQILEMPYAKKQ